MGTNFYLRDANRDTDRHIGKRSAAGYYCWDCKQTLCKGGESRIHSGTSKWHETCPQCKSSRIEETWEDSAVGKELGFNEAQSQAKTGVRTCCSFVWAMPQEEMLKNCKGLLTFFRKPIIDEYEQCYTLQEFQQILEECPVQYTKMIGERFS